MEQTTTGYLKNLKMVHKAMVVMHIVLPLLVIVLLKFVNTKVEKYTQFHQVMQWVLPVVLVACIIGAAFIFKSRVDAILGKQQETLLQKLTDYKSACIVRWSIIDMPIGLSTAMLLLTGNYYYLIFAFTALVLMLLYAPSKIQMANHLQLSTSEQAILDDEYAVL